MDNLKMFFGFVLGLFFGMIVTYPGVEEYVNKVIYGQEKVELSETSVPSKFNFKGYFNDAVYYEIEIILEGSALSVEDSQVLREITTNVKEFGLKVPSTNSNDFNNAIQKYIKMELVDNGINYKMVTFIKEDVGMTKSVNIMTDMMIKSIKK